ncbi:hypothetical protein GQ53DRAFT_845118 [Thozetella sp. PMI_491]|nr:hypothetical protein GQ53DRAFT_845118 [Thozetella sp. PMI_491]
MSTTGNLTSLPPEYLAEYNGQKLMDGSIAIIVLITVVYVLFNVSRFFFAERNSLETWVLYPISYLFSLGSCILCILFVQIGGAGRHFAYWMITDPTVIGVFLKLQTATESVYMAGVTLPKVAILLLYLRVFVAERKIWIGTCIVLGVVVANYVCTGLIATFTICQPFAFKWDKTIPGGHCANLMAAYRYISIPNILTDLAILILPLSPLYRLQLSPVRKFGLLVTFLAGSLGIITAVIRFVGFYTVDLESDLTYLGVDTNLYTIIEPCAYFICSCLPGIRPLVRAVYMKTGVLATGKSRSTKTSGSYDISPGNSKNGHTVILMTPTRKIYGDDTNNTGGFVRLQETASVDQVSASG